MIAEFIYCYILKPRPLRVITNWLIKKLIPKKVKIGKATLFLNPNDPVVSGAIFFNVYETTERKFIKSISFKGMKVLDIGANIGYYTALLSQEAGDNGLILALEPDLESYKYLSQSIRSLENNNVLSFPVAASNLSQRLPLYISKENRGDNRLYKNNQKRDCIIVDCLTIDELSTKTKIESFDLIKIDVQGYEPKVFKGMGNTIKSSRNLTILTEFWPKGIMEAGESPANFLRTLRKMKLKLFELKKNGSLVSLNQFRDNEFIKRFSGRKYTNIVCKK
tara:strand:- start:1610 stop:2443 length:834 start_codon:yes stop_codon:yes gene_type:complete